MQSFVHPSENYQILKSLDSLVQNITENQKVFCQKVAEIKDNHYTLVKSYYQESQRLIKMLKETAFLCSLMFSIEDEKSICVSAINILRKLLQEPVTIRILCASSSRTKLETVAEEKSAAHDIKNVCSKSPLNCIAIKTCRSIIYSPLESTVPCPEMLDSPDQYTYACVPLVAEGVAFGCINILFEHETKMDRLKENIDLINILAGYASLAIYNNRLIKTVKREALTDKLTGLPNRRFGMEALQGEINRSKRYGHVFSVAMLDIDNFKLVNDNYGHTEGDKVLTLMADLARKCLRNVDLVARFGGEEFLIILPETDIKRACAVVERFCRVFNEASLTDVLCAKNLTLSGGIAQFPHDGEDALSLLKTADERLYLAKSSGRNRIVADKLN
ncbi:sensor domain-containing diguanylate cyclase [Desulfofundulus thermosubterraneus]|uniref:Diguanylate cyclase (GGDEF) domain-containing protein n=1 Tax=Desulfofundulus thermosubterraneus DSM 16057 TaxID=1121432 RepID=A0A1M6EIT5_9FIRM|nr:diguanylate cyclase [Desulfofundulus thermosubterraneus]SHI85392.1 diguanylate cyclase (GGDEF) domain-containing protein [Desulfofundulus thermosubterraneus DSM 16057]